jgi:hypothetical protein
MIIDCEISVWDVRFKHSNTGQHHIVNATLMDRPLDIMYLTSPFVDTVKGFVSASVWASLLPVSANPADQFIPHVERKIPEIALGFSTAFAVPTLPSEMQIWDGTTNLYPMPILVLEGLLSLGLAAMALGLLGRMWRLSSRITRGIEIVHEELTDPVAVISARIGDDERSIPLNQLTLTNPN